MVVALSRAASAAVLLMQFFCNRAAASMDSSKCCYQADAIELRGAAQLHSWFVAVVSFALIIDVDDAAPAIRRRAPRNGLCSLAHRDQSSRTDHARRLSGPSDVCTSMNWGVRIALLTSDHFAAPGQLKLRFSAAPGPDPSNGVLGVMRRASRARYRFDVRT